MPICTLKRPVMDRQTLQPLKANRSATVILMGGLPASGKSTLARRLVAAFSGDEKGTERRAIHLEYDAFEDSIAAQKSEQQSPEAWNQARRATVTQLEDHLRNQFASSNDKDPPLLILMDDNFHLRGMRKQIHRLLLNFKPVNFGVIWMQTPLETCLDRNRRRARQIPEHVLQKMNENLEPPRTGWENYWLPVGDGTSFQTIVSFVESCAEIVDLPEKVDEAQQEADRQITMQSQSHNWDKLLRSWVGKVAKYDKNLARSANDSRKGVMELAKDPDNVLGQEDLSSAFIDLLLSSDKSKSREELIFLLAD